MADDMTTVTLEDAENHQRDARAIMDAVAPLERGIERLRDLSDPRVGPALSDAHREQLAELATELESAVDEIRGNAEDIEFALYLAIEAARKEGGSTT